MKKRTLVIAIVALMVLTAMPVVAQNNGQTLNIGGLVPLQLTLTVNQNTVTQNLPLTLPEGSPAADTTQTIATVEIGTNNSAGWELHVFSTNAGSSMLNSEGDTIPYTIELDDVASTLGNLTIGDTGVPIAEATSDAGIAAPGANLNITYEQRPDHPAGYFSDQLALVLRAK